MSSGAPLSIPELRQSSRHPIDLKVVGEHLVHGETKLHITNISLHGFMISNASDDFCARGDRIIIRLPVIGRIEAYCIWMAGERAGFQFERIIRTDDFADFLKQPQTQSRLQNKRRA